MVTEKIVESARAVARVEELLRFVTPAMYFGRTVVNDVSMHGRQLVKGDFVMLWHQNTRAAILKMTRRDPLR